MWALIEFPLGLVYANALEWLIHKYLLHGVGRNKKSIWAFHWHEHHQSARKHAFVDEAYSASLRSWDTKTKEIVSLLAIALAHVPLFFVAPWFTVAAWLSAANYFRVHRKAHMNPQWAREHLPWHFDHHMGPNQNANWCATFPLFDWLLGTREHYLAAERERDSRARPHQDAAG